ncbi:MAG: YtxH domain-containing protein [Dehalococcoidia bacterium]
MMINHKNTGRFVTGLVAGALVGTSIGLLSAPKPGKETRQAVREKAEGYVTSIRERRRKHQTAESEAGAE